MSRLINMDYVSIMSKMLIVMNAIRVLHTDLSVVSYPHCLQKTSICYLSFPDSYSGKLIFTPTTETETCHTQQQVNLTVKLTVSVCLFPGCLGDTQFSFRFRQSIGRNSPDFGEDAYDRDAPVTLQVRPCLVSAPLH